MAGLYVHIPFCQSRCIYCGFYSTTALALRRRYVDALCREMELRATELESTADADGRGTVGTVYLGGGTPSQLPAALLRRLFIYINKVYRVAPDAELTIEVNPDDVTPQLAALLPEVGVNRVSMGVQTFDDQRLRLLRRRHTAQQACRAVRLLRQGGIGNISVDLMYGLPGQTLEAWHADIDQALALDVEHLSAYCLTIEEHTPLWRLQAEDGKLKMKDTLLQMPDEETQRAMYETLINRLTAAGYQHYEISNFARPGRHSRHNTAYWTDVPYVGLGAAAHSYSGQRRSWNVSDIHRYMESVERGVLPAEGELMDDDTHYNDRVATALRTADGLPLDTLSERHRRYCLAEAQRLLTDGLLALDAGRLRITRRGLFVSDSIMAALMFVE